MSGLGMTSLSRDICFLEISLSFMYTFLIPEAILVLCNNHSLPLYGRTDSL